MWQPSCQNCRGGERKNLIGILEMKLPKMEEKKKKNYGIQVAEIGEKRREKLIWVENWRKKKRIVAMELSKNWRRERERERVFRLKKYILQYRFLF